MLMNRLGISILSCLIIANLLCLALHAKAGIKVKTNDLKTETIDVPLYILKDITLIYNISTDLKIYDENSDSVEQEYPIELETISSAVFKNILDVVSIAKRQLHADAVKADGKPHEDFAINQVKEEKQRQFFDEAGSWTWPKMSAAELLTIIQAAHHLDIGPVVNAAVKVFAKTGSKGTSTFFETIKDIQALIIKKQNPREFMALIGANWQQDNMLEDELFNMAMIIHYGQKEEPGGMSAKERYKQLRASVLGQFISIPSGTYEIGSPETEADHKDDEGLHSVNLSQFSIMEGVVAQEQYAKVTGVNPSKFVHPKYCPESFKEIEVGDKKIPVCADHPVETVSFYDVQKFIDLMNEEDPEHTYSLPTEAQLEVAFRGGTMTAYVSGVDEVGLGDYIWYNANSGHQTHPVKSRLANKYGIYRGSVWEWVNDSYGPYDADYTGLDPQGPLGNSFDHVVRGGSWYDSASRFRSAYRCSRWSIKQHDNIGFRLVRR